MSRITPNLPLMLGKIASTFRKVIPVLIEESMIPDEDQHLFSLPLYIGGLNIRKPLDHSEDYFCKKNVAEHRADRTYRKRRKQKKIKRNRAGKNPKADCRKHIFGNADRREKSNCSRGCIKLAEFLAADRVLL